jgi:DNA-binding transcriptional MocR family regulator
MLQALKEHFPAGSKWTTPEGGLFIWATLSGDVSGTELLEQAVRAKVAFIPGTPFFASGGGDNCMRLNFSNASSQDIQTGIGRLGNVIKDAIDKVK